MIFHSTKVLFRRHHRRLDSRNGLRRIEALGAAVGTVHDGMAAVEFEGIVERMESLLGGAITAVLQPALGLKQH